MNSSRTSAVRKGMELFAKTFFCPNLVTQADEMIIEQTLQGAPGVETVEIDHGRHIVWVSTANQSGLGEIEAMLGDAGYAPANAGMPSPQAEVL